MRTAEKLFFLIFVLAFLLLINITVFSQNNNNMNVYYQRFLNARSFKNETEMQKLIHGIENELKTNLYDNSEILKLKTLLSEVYFEYAQLLQDNKLKEKYYNHALKTAKEIIKDDVENGKAYYVAAMASVALIQFVNIFHKLLLMKDFDSYIDKAIKYMEDSTYKGLSYLAKGVRFMTPPSPFNDLRKSEQNFLEAEEYISDYSGLYLNWGLLYLKMGDKKRAKEMFQKVLRMPPHPLFRKQHEENVKKAKLLLDYNK
jgi:tetratricopeptide (TPR) repeat protein